MLFGHSRQVSFTFISESPDTFKPGANSSLAAVGSTKEMERRIQLDRERTALGEHMTKQMKQLQEMMVKQQAEPQPGGDKFHSSVEEPSWEERRVKFAAALAKGDSKPISSTQLAQTLMDSLGSSTSTAPAVSLSTAKDLENLFSVTVPVPEPKPVASASVDRQKLSSSAASSRKTGAIEAKSKTVQSQTAHLDVPKRVATGGFGSIKAKTPARSTPVEEKLGGLSLTPKAEVSAEDTKDQFDPKPRLRMSLQERLEQFEAEATSIKADLAAVTEKLHPVVPDPTPAASTHQPITQDKSNQYGIPMIDEEEDDNSDASSISSAPSLLPRFLKVNVGAPLSRLDTPTYVDGLLKEEGHTAASSALLHIVREENVKLDTSLGLKLLKFAESLKTTGDMAPVGLSTSNADVAELQIASYKKTSERLDDFAGMLNAIASAVGVPLEENGEGIISPTARRPVPGLDQPSAVSPAATPSFPSYSEDEENGTTRAPTRMTEPETMALPPLNVDDVQAPSLSSRFSSVRPPRSARHSFSPYTAMSSTARQQAYPWSPRFARLRDLYAGHETGLGPRAQPFPPTAANPDRFLNAFGPGPGPRPATLDPRGPGSAFPVWPYHQQGQQGGSDASPPSIPGASQGPLPYHIPNHYQALAAYHAAMGFAPGSGPGPMGPGMYDPLLGNWVGNNGSLFL